MKFDLGALLVVATMALSASALTVYAVSDARSLGSGRKPAPGVQKEAGGARRRLGEDRALCPKP